TAPKPTSKTSIAFVTKAVTSPAFMASRAFGRNRKNPVLSVPTVRIRKAKRRLTMSMLFLRVGIDRGCGGTLSPRFENGTFEYVPIPEFSEVGEGRGITYREVPARYCTSLEKYSGSNRYTHYDPEFETYTY